MTEIPATTISTTTTAASPLARAGARAAALARGGTASVVAGNLYSNALRIVSSMTLTRLLVPEAFGAVGVVMSVSLVLVMLSDVGLYPFIVRHEEGDDPAFLDQVWTLRLARSVGLTAAMAALSWPAAAFMEKPALAPLLALYSLSFLIEGSSSLAFATAVRQGRLWQLTLLEIIAATAQLAVGVAIALAFRSTWTLVLAILVAGVLRAVLSYRMFPGSGRRLVWNAARAGELWAFSRMIAGSSFLTLLILQTDKLVLARLLPFAEYGHYVIAATLASAPAPLAGAYAQRVLFPAYADAFRRGGAAALAEVFYPRRRAVLLLYLAATGALIGGAPLVVRLLYDARYAEVALPLGLLAVSSAAYLLSISSDEALVAAGWTRWPFYASAARVLWLGAGLALALLRGDTMLLIAAVGLMELAAVAVFWTGLHRLGVLRPGQEALGLLVAVAAAALGRAAAVGAAALLPP